MDFDTRKIITAIAIQSYISGSSLNLSVKKFQLMYTEDSYIWKKHLEIGFIEVGTIRCDGQPLTIKRSEDWRQRK